MKTSIYIASGQIEVIGYSKTGKQVKIDDYISTPINEGTMINGMIMDQGELVEKLAFLRAKKPQLFKNAHLVMDGNSLVTKKIPVPNLTKRQYYQVVQDDLNESTDNFENLVFDYSFMGTANDQSAAILACGTNKATIESYVNTFSESGIGLSSISVGLETILNFVKLHQKLSKETFVLNVLDEFSMLSVIFNEGKYVFSTRTRLFGEDIEQFLLNILEGLSTLIQFNKSQQLSDIEASYYLGLNDVQMDFLQKRNSYSKIKIAPLDIYSKTTGIEKINTPSHFAFLGIFNDSKSINLLSSYKNSQKQKTVKKKANSFVIITCMLILVLGGAFAYPLLQTWNLNKEIDQIETYLTDTKVTAKVEEIEALIAKINSLTTASNQINQKTQVIESKPFLTSEILSIITTTNSGKVILTNLSFNEESSTIRFVGSSATESYSAEYVEALKKNEQISDIRYTGYSYDNSVKKRFNFSIDIVLKSKKQGVQD